ncbi:hypothetical protein OKW26_003799 [Paraburkholderia sp. 32]
MSFRNAPTCSLFIAPRFQFYPGDNHCDAGGITVDCSGANLAALEALNAERFTSIKVRQNKYLNNVVEQDHRAIKRIIKPMLGFKAFRCARIILSGIEIAHMIRKGQLCDDGVASTTAEQFYSLAVYVVLLISRFTQAVIVSATEPAIPQ